MPFNAILPGPHTIQPVQRKRKLLPFPRQGLVSWHDAAVGIRQTATGQVSQWDDISGNRNHATQPTVANQPYAAFDYRGRPCVRFGALVAAWWMQLPTTTTVLVRSVSVFVVVSNSNGYQTGGVVSLNGVAGNSVNLRQFSSTSTASRFTIGSTVSAIPLMQNKIAIGTTSSASGVGIYSSVTAPQTGSAVTNDATARPIVLGIGPTGSSYMIGDIAEIIIFNRALSAAESKQVIDYLTAKHRLATYFDHNLITEGDSITQGTGQSGNDLPLSYPWWVLQKLQPHWRLINRGVSGATIASMTTRSTSVDLDIDLTMKRNILIYLIGRNDAAIPHTAATIYSDSVTYCQARVAAGWEVWVATDIAGAPTAQAVYDVLNPMLRGTPLGGTGNGIIADAGASKVVDYGADSLFDATGDSGNLNYYQNDSTHPNTAGQKEQTRIFMPYQAS